MADIKSCESAAKCSEGMDMDSAQLKDSGEGTPTGDKDSAQLKDSGEGTPTGDKDTPLVTITDVDLATLLAPDNTNANKVLCTRCGSVVMSAHQGQLLKTSAAKDDPAVHSLPLPLMTQQKADLQQGLLAQEQHVYYWLLADMMRLDNAGFTHAVDAVKYLTCADCELGPIGYQRTDTKQCLVALARVKQGV